LAAQRVQRKGRHDPVWRLVVCPFHLLFAGFLTSANYHPIGCNAKFEVTSVAVCCSASAAPAPAPAFGTPRTPAPVEELVQRDVTGCWRIFVRLKRSALRVVGMQADRSRRGEA